MSDRLLISITHLRVRSVRLLPEFLRHSNASIAAASAAAGNRGVRARPGGVHDWYTMTAWDDEASMMAFVRGPVHLEAMRSFRRLASLSETGRFHHDGPIGDITWQEARRNLAPLTV